MIIRTAKKSDVKPCYELGKIKEFELPDGSYMNIKFFEFHVGNPFFIVAEEKKKIIGYAVGDPFEGRLAGMLWYIMIKKEHRSKGIGDKLLKEFEKRFIKAGIRWLVLYTPSFNNDSIKFYKNRSYNIGKTFVECTKQLF